MSSKKEDASSRFKIREPIVLGAGFGVAIGASIGAVFGEVEISVSIGIALGTGVGVAMMEYRNRKGSPKC